MGCDRNGMAVSTLPLTIGEAVAREAKRADAAARIVLVVGAISSCGLRIAG